MTDKPTDEALENLFVEETGFDIDDFPAAIFGFARAVLAKWGTPAPVGVEPVAWTLTAELEKRETTTRAHLWFSDPVNCMWTPLYTTPQHTQTQPAAHPDAARSAGADDECAYPGDAQQAPA